MSAAYEHDSFDRDREYEREESHDDWAELEDIDRVLRSRDVQGEEE